MANGPPTSRADEGAELPDTSADAGDEERRALVSFRVGTTLLAIDALAVREICDMCEPVAIPRAPEHIPGLMNSRGHAIPLLDLGQYLGLAVAPTGPAADDDVDLNRRIIVIQENGMRVGVLCDQVRGVAEVATSSLKAPQVTQLGSADTQGVVEAEWESPRGWVVLLNLALVLESTRIRR